MNATRLAPILAMAAYLLAATPFTSAARAAEPAVGAKAPHFELKDLEGQRATLPDLAAKGKVVLVVLRGWPGYQCPICTRQVADLLANKEAFEQAGATVAMIYPGPADGLRAHAAEFKGETAFPAHYRFLTDPDYTFTNAYGLRWDAKGETAYPSTLVIDREGKFEFVRVSKTHGGRVSAKEVLEHLK